MAAKKFPKYKLLRMLPKIATGNTRAIAEFVIVLLEWAATKTENPYDDETVEQIRKLLDL
ncbi:MAG: hypothetical protein COB66_01465 [Coxiella sp. (in: Bacteria)]|nr:MAG: hypothetical protein COB66_01465 [Coxiella sp. (in: g-proteobacteria)]